MPTTVISVRGMRPEEFSWDPDFIYCGRAIFRMGWKASIWGNPFKFDKDRYLFVDFSRVRPEWWAKHCGSAHGDARTILDLYRQWVLDTPSLRARIPELYGKTLGCWCGFWEPGKPEIPCHAVVLAKLADGLVEEKG